MKLDTEHLRQKAEIFLKNDIKVFIKDYYNNLYFCKIKEIFKDWVIIIPFKGNMNGKMVRILWIDIIKFQEYKENLK